jgi:hypothetical protein
MKFHALIAALPLILANWHAPAAGINDIRQISGGIGEAEQVQLAAREREFNLKLVFSLVEGNYVSDVSLAISDARGTRVAEHVARGPFYLARLPAGQYTVTATYEGRTVSRSFRLAPDRLRTEHLRWPSDPRTDLPVSRWVTPE